MIRADQTVALGKESVTTRYDAASMPSWMTGGFGWGTYVAASVMDERGRLVAADLGNTYGNVVTYQYEHGTDRLAQIVLNREGVCPEFG